MRQATRIVGSFDETTCWMTLTGDEKANIVKKVLRAFERPDDLCFLSFLQKNKNKSNYITTPPATKLPTLFNPVKTSDEKFCK